MALKTDNLAEAQRSRPEAERLYHAAVDASRLSLASASDGAALTHADALALAPQWFRSALIDLQDWFGPKKR